VRRSMVSLNRSRPVRRISLAVAVVGCAVLAAAEPASDAVLQGTELLAAEGDLAAQMVAGIDAFLEREGAAAVAGTLEIRAASGLLRAPLRYRIETAEPLDRKVVLESDGGGSVTIELAAVPRTIRSLLVEGILEQERAKLLAKDAPLSERLDRILRFLGRCGSRAPLWLESFSRDLLERRLFKLVLLLQESA